MSTTTFWIDQRVEVEYHIHLIILVQLLSNKKKCVDDQGEVVEKAKTALAKIMCVVVWES